MNNVFGLSYNCSTSEGTSVGDSSEGFDITVIGTTMEQMEAYVKANVKAENCGTIAFSTTHAAIGEFIDQLGCEDVDVVAVVTETFMDDDEEITTELCLVFDMMTTLLT